MMSTRANTLADQLAASNQAMIDLIDAAPDAAWGRVSEEEGWTVPAIGAHVATQHDFLIDRVRRIVEGAENPPFDPVAFHEANRQAAAANATLPREQVRTLLRDHGAAATTYLRGLSDDDLDCTRLIPAMGEQPVTAQTVIEMVLIGHVEAHLKSLRQMLA
jgi:hypothetical protein